MKVNAKYDGLTVFGAWTNAAYYSFPVIIIFLIGNYFEISQQYIYQIVIVYFIAAIAHMAAYGGQSINNQIHASSEFIVKENKKNQK